MKFSAKIVFMRKKRNISQDKLAKKMGVSRQTIYKWEADLNTPEFNKIEKLAEILNISYDLLLDDSIDLETYFNENKEESSENINQSTVPNERGINKKVLFIVLGIAFSIIILTAIIVGTVLGNDTNTDTGSSIITDTSTDTDTNTNSDTNSDTDTGTDTTSDIMVDSHKWSDWQEIDKGSCDTPQALERVCSECGKKETKTGEILFEHRFSNHWYTKSPATCTETEIQFSKCHDCNTERYRDGIAAPGHAYQNEICVRCGNSQYTDGVVYEVYNNQAYVYGYTGTSSVVSISPYYTPKGETTKYPVTEVRRINSDVVKELIIPEGVEKVGNWNFNCFNLEVVRFPTTLTQIFEGTFTSCIYLKTVHIKSILNWCGVATANNEMYGARFFGVPYNMYLNNELLTDLHITEDVKNIMPYVFANCMSIKTLTMEYIEWGRTIYSHAFEESGLEYVQLDGVTISEYAFMFCNHLKSVSFSKSTYFNSRSVFVMCYHLVELFTDKEKVIMGDTYTYGSVAQYARIIHTSLEEPSVLTETEDGFIFATIDNANYLIQYVGSDPVVKLPRSFKGENYTIVSHFYESGSPNTAITEIYVPKEVKYIEERALQANKQLKVYFEVVAPLVSWEQRLTPSEYVFYGQALDY